MLHISTLRREPKNPKQHQTVNQAKPNQLLCQWCNHKGHTHLWILCMNMNRSTKLNNSKSLEKYLLKKKKLYDHTCKLTSVPNLLKCSFSLLMLFISEGILLNSSLVFSFANGGFFGKLGGFPLLKFCLRKHNFNYVIYICEFKFIYKAHNTNTRHFHTGNKYIAIKVQLKGKMKSNIYDAIC